MRQSSVIFGALILAFVIYITMRGQLPGYLALFSSSKSAVTSSTNSQASTETNASKGGIDWEGVTAGDWGAIADLTKNVLPTLGF